MPTILIPARRINPGDRISIFTVQWTVTASAADNGRASISAAHGEHAGEFTFPSDHRIQVHVS